MRAFIKLLMKPMGKARPRHCGTHSYMPKPYMDYKKEAIRQIKEQISSSGPITTALRLETHFYTKSGKCRSDASNSHDTIADCLQDARIIHNDRQIIEGEYKLAPWVDDMDADQIHVYLETL